ncbi:hypothetical protein GH714_031471 [Hevea brasiliensis]|uniref:Uncharacterized protein n=1 Tax=Hevea brasiliensis TaxID=3981 RepID=A0A6A6LE63_HEVBR|nr:hypothetical protein GH714_031471 [Hevea brasiliensis]
MGSLSEEEYRFFDAHEETASISDGKSDIIETFDSHSSADNSIPNSPHYEVWMKSPISVEERRSKFFSWMGVGLDQCSNESSVTVHNMEGEIDRIREISGAVLRKSVFEDEFCSTRSTMSCWSNDNSNLLEELGSKVDFICREGTSGGGMVCNDEVSLEHSVTAEESGNTSGSSPSFKQLVQQEIEEPSTFMGTPKSVKKRWLSRLRSIACVVDKQRAAEKLRHDGDDSLLEYRVQRVKVRQHGKRTKELSALYKGQDIQAHEGSIRTMKFSLDGRYLASAGEDRIVRVWQVLEDERSNELDIPEIDPSCIYFTVNQLSELKPLFTDKEKTAKHLLSASEDKSVRLWQVGNDHCLRVFSHNNYVTCVQFNPVDDNYFMSGSIDGKVRIWAIPSCQVVDWTDIKEMVTAVCYHPNGQGGIVGSMGGNCRFYDMSDSHLELDARICLHNKKKSPCKRITGFQFFPRDSTKVMVTCADSQVRILQGLNVIGKYTGLKDAASQISACFTSDGKHIISACEDSNIYVWNCFDQKEHSPVQAKKIRSCERFSTNASVAIPWCGFQNGNSENGGGFYVSNDDSLEAMPFSSPAGFSLGQEYFLEPFPKGSATWPEETLPSSSPLSTSSAMHKSQYKFLKASCQSTATSHAWGLVIVTAGWDGRIRSFHNYGLPVNV